MNDADPITVGEIQSATASYFHMRRSDITGRETTMRYTRPRQIAMWLCRALTDCSYPKIADLFGGRDHSTVIHGVQSITKILRKEPGVRIVVQDIRRQIVKEHK